MCSAAAEEREVVSYVQEDLHDRPYSREETALAAPKVSCAEAAPGPPPFKSVAAVAAAVEKPRAGAPKPPPAAAQLPSAPAGPRYEE